MNNEIQFILYQLPDEEGRVQVVISKMEITTQHGAIVFTMPLQNL